MKRQLYQSRNSTCKRLNVILSLTPDTLLSDIPIGTREIGNGEPLRSFLSSVGHRRDIPFSQLNTTVWPAFRISNANENCVKARLREGERPMLCFGEEDPPAILFYPDKFGESGNSVTGLYSTPSATTG